MNLIRVEVSYTMLHDALGLPPEVGVGYVAAIGGKTGVCELVLTSDNFPDVPNGGIIPLYDAVMQRNENGTAYSFRPKGVGV